jgi:hypothetical protein
VVETSDPYLFVRILLLVLILICSCAITYFAVFVNNKLGEVIEERDAARARVIELEKLNIELKVRLEMQGLLQDEQLEELERI